MYFKVKEIKGRKYKYVVKYIRLPSGKVVSLEVLYKNQSKKDLEEFFEEREKKARVNYALKEFKIDYIFTNDQIVSSEEIKFHSEGGKVYKTALQRLSVDLQRELHEAINEQSILTDEELQGLEY